MRLLHLIAEMGIGGAESLVAELVRHGPSLGWESAVASSGGARVASVTQAGRSEHFFVPLVQRQPVAMVSAVRQFKRAVSTFEPDVVMAHNVGATLVASVAAGLTRRSAPLVSVFHGVSARDYRAAARVLDHGPDRVVAVSQALRTRLSDAGMRRRDVTVIPNAVPIPVLPPRSNARRALGLDAEVPVALCVARIVEQKRHDVLLRAWARLPDEAVLLLAGDGGRRIECERLAASLGLDGSVRFLGVRSDVATLLAAADVSTLASDWEGLPMAVLESMAAGLPFVGSAVDGIAEVVHSGEGILVPSNAPDALSAALSELLFDPAACRAAGNAARRGVVTRHRLDTMTAAYAQLVSAVADRGRGTTSLRAWPGGR